MAKYHFDIQRDGALTRDEEGDEMPDLAAAQHNAAITAGELCKVGLASGDDGELAVIVRDENGAHPIMARVSWRVETA